MRDLIVTRLGRIPYRQGLTWQFRTADSVRAGSSADVLGLLEHDPVYTMGARGGRGSLLADEAELAKSGIDVVDVDRGGDITYHGPGQLVAYPILRLADLGIGPSDYVHRLEDVIVGVLAEFGIVGAADPHRPGVWTDGGKIAAVGVRCQRGVTRHGIAINVELDLKPFSSIVPCGLSGIAVTSLSQVRGRTIPMAAVESSFEAQFAGNFGYRMDPDRN